ncbi:reverse transcriptase domain-containing protein [Tanacetum coccineum]
MPRECLKIIESKSKVRQSRNKAVVAKMSTSSSTQAVSSDVAELKDMVRAFNIKIVKNKPQLPPEKRVEHKVCNLWGEVFFLSKLSATYSNMYHDNIQVYVSQAVAANSIQANLVIDLRLPPRSPLIFSSDVFLKTSSALIDGMKARLTSCWQGKPSIQLGPYFKIHSDYTNDGQSKSTSSIWLVMSILKRDSDFLLFEEADSFLALEDDPTSSEVTSDPIDPKDKKENIQHAHTEKHLLSSHAFWAMQCSGSFQRCMMAIFHDMIEKTMEVFMDDFSVFGDSFSTCLTHLEKMLKRCEDTNLSLNWEKSHFMVKEGIVSE